MLENTMYDNIVHEHVGYYALHHMNWIMEKIGLEIFNVTTNDVYGGSLRLFIKKRGCLKYKKSENYEQILLNEKKIKIYNLSTYKKFTKKIERTRQDLLVLCKKIKSQKKSIGYMVLLLKAILYFNIPVSIVKQ